VCCDKRLKVLHDAPAASVTDYYKKYIETSLLLADQVRGGSSSEGAVSVDEIMAWWTVEL
jgi:hypothetical protein